MGQGLLTGFRVMKVHAGSCEKTVNSCNSLKNMLHYKDAAVAWLFNHLGKYVYYGVRDITFSRCLPS